MGTGPFVNMLRGKGRDGVMEFLICLIGTGKGIMSHFMSFPEKGRDTNFIHLLATAAVSHHIEFMSLESLDKFTSELQVGSPEVS